MKEEAGYPGWEKLREQLQGDLVPLGLLARHRNKTHQKPIVRPKHRPSLTRRHKSGVFILHHPKIERKYLKDLAPTPPTTLFRAFPLGKDASQPIHHTVRPVLTGAYPRSARPVF